MARSGIGTVMTFATSAFAPKIRNYSDIGVSREKLDATHMGSPAGVTFPGIIFKETSPGDLGESKSISIDVIFDPDDNSVPIDEDPEVITITFKTVGAQVTGATLVFTGYVSDWSAGVPYDGLMTGTLTVEVSGEMVWSSGA